MRTDILLCGVGGQGVLSMAAIIGRAAIAGEYFARQSEVHGMAQRGGGVQAHLRLSGRPIASDLISRGGAHLVLSMEPLEGLRYLSYLAPDGALITAAEPVVNIPDYPPLADLHERIRRIPGATLLEAGRLAAEAGDPQALNAVMVGAASARLPMSVETLEGAVREIFAAKGAAVIELNLAAFRAGRAAVECDGVAAAR
ncbi:MAG TPA: indolepyruvate oxidoreductase subunit beta [Dongiaceae bacterium]|nr:indolepyruvate oxidoreductase subunit beta [Dongiaceae bacterium]